MKNKRIDLNKSETQSGSFNKRQLIDFIKASNTCIGKDILIQHEYIEIIDANNNMQKELNSKSICGTIEITQGKQEMKIDKTDLILQEIRNIKDDFNEFKVEVKNEFKKVNARLDNVEKDFNEFKVEVKDEFKKVNNEIKKVNSRLDSVEKDFSEFKIEIKEELKTIKNDIKDIKNCPTIKSELNISK
ncbi:hypothetical protein [Malacoplasma muris]|uniref:hypothetical protein n=1 Tax=Malacoplasma muris TaxID=2119 RepID=UPI00398E436A